VSIALTPQKAVSKNCSGLEHEADKGTLQGLHRFDFIVIS